MADALIPSARPSLYGLVADFPREDLLCAYREFLERRNGTLDFTQGFSRREQWLREASTWAARYEGPVDGEAFNRAYESFDAVKELSLPLVALLSFVKANASEAYGVEVVNRVRGRRYQDSPDTFRQLERTLGFEETYHTRILIGATQHFGLEVKGAFRPPLQLRMLIGTLCYAPDALFHPVLLASEVAGVFTFQWLLKRVGEIFRDQPAVRECMERRLIEILVDEVGHVAFNRMAVGPKGLAVARRMTGGVLRGVMGTTPEYRALGMDENELRKLDTFELRQLPAEVLRRAYFV